MYVFWQKVNKMLMLASHHCTFIIKSMKHGNPKIIIPQNSKPWPHELRVAKILCAAGYWIEFIPESDTAKTPDILLNNVPFEIKSPTSHNINAIERNLKRATKQSRNIVFDSSRMKGLPDNKIYTTLYAIKKRQPQIDKIIFVTKKHEIIEIDK